MVLGRASGAVLAWSKKERRGREWAGREEVSWPGQVCGVRIQAFSCQAKRWPVTEGNRGDQCVVVTQCGGHTGCDCTRPGPGGVHVPRKRSFCSVKQHDFCMYVSIVR